MFLFLKYFRKTTIIGFDYAFFSQKIMATMT
jgi:hypothetical protein